VNRRRTCGLVAILSVLSLAGCGGARNREALTYSYDEVFASGSWVTGSFHVWSQEAELQGALPTYSDLGAYPIGNGRVFGIVGLTLPLGTVQDIIGPTYQKTAGLLGAQVPSVLIGGEPMVSVRQSTTWIAPCGIVHSQWEHDPLQVDLLQTVPPELDAVLSLILVTNGGDEAVEDVILAMASTMPHDSAVEGDLVYAREGTRVRTGFAGARTRILRRSIVPPMPADLSGRLQPQGALSPQAEESRAVGCPIGRVAPGESVGKIAYATVADSPERERQIIAEIEERGWELFEESHQWWQDWHERTLRVEGVSDEIDQFMTIQKYLCRVQQAEAGGYSPMHKYSYRWIRDANGPIRFLLDCGDFESVARDLRYHFAACSQQKRIFNNAPLNRDPEDVPKIDWAGVPTPKAEIASFVILQNYWYWRHTGETKQLEERWDYLDRAFEGHEIDEEGRLPFHGDETYRFPGYQLFGSEPEAVADYVQMTLRSADSAFEYVAAARAMASMARAIGREAAVQDYLDAADRVRRATERHYWQRDRGYYAPAMSAVSGELYRYPFANICLRPLWIGYHEPDSEQQITNVLRTLEQLYRPEAGTCNLTPTCGYSVGMTPGYVLSALAAIDHPEAEEALKGLLATAEPSGGYAEMNRPDDTPARGVWGLHRARPWEGGINAGAVLQYLTGFEPDAPNRRVRLAPHLAGVSTSMTVSNLRVGDANLMLRVSRQGRQTACRVTCTEADEPIEVELIVSAEGRRLRAVGGNFRDHGGRASEGRPRFGRAHLRVHGVSLGEGDELTATAEASGWARTASLDVADEPFDYGRADVRRGATLLLTWSAEVAEQVRDAEGEVTVMDTRIAWPASYLRSALLDGDAPRATRVILDVDGFPGAFKRAEFWTEGEGAEVISEYEAAGGIVERASVPAAGGAPSGELIN